MKINITSFNQKKTKIDKSYDVSTSAEFGFVQPILCEEVIPESIYNLNSATQVQTSPLLSPLFGRMSLRRFTSFVAMEDIFHHFPEVYTGRRISHGKSSTLVTDVPSVSYRFILEKLLAMNNVCTVYRKRITGSGLTLHDNYFFPVNGSVATNIVRDLFITDNYTSPSIVSFNPSSYDSDVPSLPLSQDRTRLVNVLSNTATREGDDPYNFDLNNVGVVKLNENPYFVNLNQKYVERFGNQPTIDDADVVIYQQENQSTDKSIYAVCFRFSQLARNFRKALIGLGLNLDFRIFSDDYISLSYPDPSLLPFMAYYKAWFDLMYPKREINYADTYCGKLTSFFDSSSHSGLLDFTIESIPPEYKYVLKLFADIADMTYVFNNDYYTSHFNGSIGFGGDSHDSFEFSNPPFDNVLLNDEPSLPPYENNPDVHDVNSSFLKLVSAANNFALSGTVIGARVNDYLRKHGVSVPEQSSFIDSEVLNIDTGTVLSTVENENSFLGQKGGIAQMRQKDRGFNFKAKTHGYIISFIAIVPKSGFSQGISPKFFHKSRYDFYNQEFDGIGYRLTPSLEYFASSNVAIQNGTTHDTLTAIGYTGRYNEYKYNTNIANGDFTRRPTQTAIGSFYLDKRFPQDDIRFFTNSVSGHETTVISRSSVPEPTSAVRFCNNELFDFNRIFAHRDDLEHSAYIKRFYEPVDDHFVIQMVNDFSVFAPVRAIADSLGTTDNMSETQSTVSNNAMS